MNIKGTYRDKANKRREKEKRAYERRERKRVKDVNEKPCETCGCAKLITKYKAGRTPVLACSKCGNERIKLEYRECYDFWTPYQNVHDYNLHFESGTADEWAKQFTVEEHLSFCREEFNILNSHLVQIFRSVASPYYTSRLEKKSDDYYHKLGLKLEEPRPVPTEPPIVEQRKKFLGLF